MEDDGGEQDYSATSVRQFDARSFLSEYVCIFFLTLYSFIWYSVLLLSNCKMMKQKTLKSLVPFDTATFQVFQMFLSAGFGKGCL